MMTAVVAFSQAAISTIDENFITSLVPTERAPIQKLISAIGYPIAENCDITLWAAIDECGYGDVFEPNQDKYEIGLNGNDVITLLNQLADTLLSL